MKILKNKNLLLFIPLLILNGISLLNMINSKLISPLYEDVFWKQLIWFILGYGIIWGFRKLKFKKIFNYAKYFYWFSCILLLLVLFIGKDINGAKCWINIYNFSFQPSEITKLALGLYLTDIATSTKLKGFKDEILIITKLFLITLIPSILVFLEPDTGAIINFLIILLVVLIFLKLNKWWYILAGILFILFISLFLIGYFFYQDTLIKIIGTTFFYRMDRLINFANGTGYQLENTLITIGSASFFGEGIGKILLYIPEAPTDFFFAFSCGNYGIFSGILILGSFLVIDIYFFKTIKKMKQPKYQLFTYTYFFIFLFQQTYNIAMNLGLVPIMGIPLTFLSYGGTNTLINYLFLAIILNFQKLKSVADS